MQLDAALWRGNQRTGRVRRIAERDLAGGFPGFPDQGFAVSHEEAGDGRAALALVPDIDADGDEEHHALDDLDLVGPDAFELEAVVQDGHHETTADGPGNRADATGDGRAADEYRRDRVELPADPVLRTGGDRPGDEDHAGQRGQDR